MKLRQKLAMVMAAAMIVTAVPVTTMAASTNSLTKTMTLVKDQTITTTQGLELIVAYTDTVKTGDVFYVTATDFTFTEEAYGKDGFAITNGFVKRLSDTELEVKVTANVNVDKIYVPIGGKVKEGTPTVTVTGNDTFATVGTTHVLGGEVTSDKSLVATVDGDPAVIAEDLGKVKVELGKIKIEEKVAAQLAGKKITLELPRRAEVEFASSTVKVVGHRSLADKTANAESVVIDKDEDNKVMTFTIPSTVKSDRAGYVTLEGVMVQAVDTRNNLSAGSVEVTVKADKMSDATLKVAEIKAEAVEMKATEVKTLTAGQGKQTVEVKITEATVGNIGSRDVILTVDGAEIVSVKGATEFDSEDQEIVLSPDNRTTKEYKLEIELRAKANTTGDVTLKAEGRDLDTIETNIAKVEAPYTVAGTGYTVKPGIKGQKGGTITITEAKDGKFVKGQEFIIKADDKDFAIKSADVKVTDGDAELFDAEVTTDGALKVKVKRTSKEAATITVNNIEMSSSKYIADGAYDFLVGGTAVSDKNNVAGKEFEEKITLNDFVLTGELTGTVAITADATEFVKNGETVAVPGDMGAFLNEDNRMLAPVRLVGEAFGVTLNSVSTSDTTVVIAQKGNTIVKFTNGSAVMEINGMQVPMNTKAVIKNDRMFLPIRDLAFAFDILVDWDAETRTATFTSK